MHDLVKIENRLNLAAAIMHLEVEIQRLTGLSVEELEKTHLNQTDEKEKRKKSRILSELLQIRNSLDAILHVHGHWLEKGLIAHYWQQQEEAKSKRRPRPAPAAFSQDDLINESRKAQTESFEFIETYLQQLLLNIKASPLSANDQYSKLLNTVQDCINAVLEVNEQWKLYVPRVVHTGVPSDKQIKPKHVYFYREDSKVKYALMDNEKKIQRDEIKLTPKEVKALFKHPESTHLSTNQKLMVYPEMSAAGYEVQTNLSKEDQKKLSIEKFKFKFEYEKNKSQLHKLAIQLGGRYIPANQFYDSTEGKEDNKISNGHCFGHVTHWAMKIKKHGKNIGLLTTDTLTLQQQVFQLNERKYDEECGYTNSKELQEIIDSIFSNLKTKYIYRLGNNNHAMGIRLIPHTHQIEFFDPNNFIIVFPNIENFKIWFSDWYPKNYSLIPNFLALNPISGIFQPQDAVATIPPLKSEITNYKELGELKHTHLKTKIKKLIEAEITRLENAWIHRDKANHKISALEELIKKIDQAAADVPLKAIIDAWLKDIDNFPKNLVNKDERTYSHIIDDKRIMNSEHSATFYFIRELRAQYEVSPVELAIQQNKIFSRAYEILESLAEGSQNPFFKDLLQDIKEFQAEEPRTDGLLSLIKSVCNKVTPSQSGFFSKAPKLPDQAEVQSFRAIFSGLDLENPKALQQAASQLETFSRNCSYRLAAPAAAQPRDPVAPTTVSSMAAS